MALDRLAQVPGDPKVLEDIQRRKAQVEAMLKQLESNPNPTPEQIDRINRSQGLVTDIAGASKPRGGGSAGVPRDIAAENAERNRARLAADQERAAEDPFVNTALINFTREIHQRAGRPINEEIIEATVKEQLRAGNADVNKIAVISANRTLDSTIKQMEKQRDALKVASEIEELTPEIRDEETGFIQLDKKSRATAIKDVSDLESNLRTADQIVNIFDKDFFTALSRFKGFTGRSAEFLGLASTQQKAHIRRRRIFSQKVELMFQKFRKLITGAQASVEELKQLEKAMINGNLAPSEAIGALAGMRAEMKLEIDAKKRLIQRGISLKSFSGDEISFRNKLDEEIRAMAAENPDIQTLLQQAQASRNVRDRLARTGGLEEAPSKKDMTIRERLEARKAELEAKQ